MLLSSSKENESHRNWQWNLEQEKILLIKNPLELIKYYSQGLSWIFTSIILTSFIIGIYPSILAILFTYIVENVLTSKGEMRFLVKLIFGVLFTYSIAGFCESIKFFLVPRFITEVSCRIRSDIYEHLLERSYLEVNQKKAEEGRQSATFLRDLTIIEDMLHRILDVSTIYIARIFTSLATIFYYNITLGLLMLSVFLIVQIGIWKLNDIYTKKIDERTQNEDIVSTSINEALLGLEVIYYYDAKNQLRSKFTEKLLRFKEKLYTELHYTTMSPGIPRIIFRTCVYIIISIASIMALSGEMTVGEVTGIIAISSIIVDPLQEINIVWSKWTRGSVSIQRVVELLSQPTADKITVNSSIANSGVVNQESDKKQSEKNPILPLQKSLYLKNISFGYDSNSLIFKEFDLILPSQGLFAINGHNGSGKSTLLKIIAGDYQPCSGKIYWDDEELNNLTISERKQIIRTVPQRPFLFQTTVIDNILICNPHNTRQDVEEIIAKMGLESLINRLPNGLNTEAGKNGSNLSGGQMQLICFIRALVSEPSVILMDEPFAAIDADNSVMMMEILQNISKEKLVIVVSHNAKLNDYSDNVIYIQHSAPSAATPTDKTNGSV